MTLTNPSIPFDIVSRVLLVFSSPSFVLSTSVKVQEIPSSANILPFFFAVRGGWSEGWGDGGQWCYVGDRSFGAHQDLFGPQLFQVYYF